MPLIDGSYLSLFTSFFALILNKKKQLKILYKRINNFEGGVISFFNIIWNEFGLFLVLL